MDSAVDLVVLEPEADRTDMLGRALGRSRTDLGGKASQTSSCLLDPTYNILPVVEKGSSVWALGQSLNILEKVSSACQV